MEKLLRNVHVSAACENGKSRENSTLLSKQEMEKFEKFSLSATDA